ncbi:MAG: hypothetical protein KGJ80_17280, partial [Chloroflexota bacterium]|nr:hypothetical protein [Chloroflexota bacterium]
GLWGDELVQRLRQSGLHTYMTFFGFFPPFPNGSNNPAQMDAIKRYVKYVVDRYGAYVDFWEMMNESPNPPITIDDGWYNQVGAYLHGIDPYQHPVATSWEKPNLGVIDVTAPHWYQKEDEFASDREVKSQIDQYKRFGKPVIFGEQGNSDANWDARSSLRMRLRSWTAFFDEGVLIFWNASCCKGATNGYASNIYLGPEERDYLKVLQDFTRGIDPRVALEDVQVSNPDLARAYALRSPTTYVAYVHNYKDHTNSTSGLRVTVNLLAGGTATWTSPTTGQVLGTQIVPAGTQTLTVPAFVTDIALKIR